MSTLVWKDWGSARLGIYGTPGQRAGAPFPPRGNTTSERQLMLDTSVYIHGGVVLDPTDTGLKLVFDMDQLAGMSPVRHTSIAGSALGYQALLSPRAGLAGQPKLRIYYNGNELSSGVIGAPANSFIWLRFYGVK